jgi:hypothetical protein
VGAIREKKVHSLNLRPWGPSEAAWVRLQPCSQSAEKETREITTHETHGNT